MSYSKSKALFLIFFVGLVVATNAYGGTTELTEGEMPWDDEMATIYKSLTGPWLQFGSVVAMGLSGLALAFNETGGVFKKLIQMVMGLAFACSATSWGLEFFGFSGGILF